MADVVYSADAEEWLENADADAREQVLKRVDNAKEFPEHFLEPYTGSPYYKLRAGDYRCVVDWQRNETPEILYIRRIGHRDGFYEP
jgi:mRNA interferase RelE/StbE